MKNLILVALIAFGLGACTTVTITPRGEAKTVVQHDFESTKPFYILGLVGKAEIDAAKVCSGAKNIRQMQTFQSFGDGLLTAITIGIYTPRTARIWCANK
ncbi:MAG: Bor family protein [Bdellovibrionales bacterium]